MTTVVLPVSAFSGIKSGSKKTFKLVFTTLVPRKSSRQTKGQGSAYPSQCCSELAGRLRHDQSLEMPGPGLPVGISLSLRSEQSLALRSYDCLGDGLLLALWLLLEPWLIAKADGPSLITYERISCVR